MNEVRERVLLSITKYLGFSEYKDLIAFCVLSEHFTDCEDGANGIEPDFDEVIAIVEKDWLFGYMDVDNPLEYLKHEYTSDDSINWFDEAVRLHKLAMISFS